MLANKRLIKIILITILLFFAVIYCLLSLPNHYLFRTFTLDLGLSNNALYHFSRFKADYSLISMNGGAKNYFGNHFAPIIFLFVPLYYFLGTYTLLIVQILSVLFGGIGVYKLSVHFKQSSGFALLILLHFFSIWSIYSTLAFDYHDNVIGSMLVPWLFLSYFKSNKRLFILFFLLILFSRENMALWLSFIILGLTFINNGSSFKERFKKLWIYWLIAIIYFIVVMKVIMPFFIGDNLGDQLSKYAHLGNSLGEISWFIVSNPWEVLQMLFVNSSHNSFYDGIKTELHFMVLISGGFLFIRYPQLILMLLPIYLQKFLVNDPIFWGISYQYSIEFVPILSLALILWGKDHGKYRLVIAAITVVITAYYTYDTLEERKSVHYMVENSDFLSKDHYTSKLNIPEIYIGLTHVDKDSKISAVNELTPHLTNRDYIYTFPDIQDSEEIVLLTHREIYYPHSKMDYENSMDQLLANPDYYIKFKNKAIVILKKKSQK